MGTNVNLSDVLKKIASDAGFLSSAGDKFKEGESLKVLFVSTGSNNSDSVVLADTSGDSYNISAQTLKGYLTDEEYNALINGSASNTNTSAEAIGATQVELAGNAATLEETPVVDSVDTTEGATAVTEAAATTATQSSTAIKEEIEALQEQRDANQQSMEALQDQIEDLKAKIEQSVADALAAMQDIEEEQKKKAEEAVAEELKRYQESNGDMTQDEFSSNVKSALAAINPSMGEALTHIMSADSNMALMSNLLNQLSQKATIDKQLGSQIDTKQVEYDSAVAAEEAAKKAAEEQAAAAAAANSCACPDPIGANFGESLGYDLDSDGDSGQIQIDFFYDEDGDGKINSMDDFVGAKADAAGGDGWDEMLAMNLDGDGTITGDEMAQSGVKVMVTEIDDDGTKTQRAMSIDEFTEQVGKGDLEISSEKHDEINNSVNGPFGFDDNANNELLGTFDIGFSDDESVDTIGYQTRDDADWLVENFGQNMDLESLKAQGVDVSAAESAQASAAAESVEAGNETVYEQFVRQYSEEVVPKLQTEINDAYAELGFTKESIDLFKGLAEATAELEGQKIADELEAKEKEALEQTEEAQDAQEAQEEQEEEIEEAVEAMEDAQAAKAEEKEEQEEAQLIDEEPDDLL